MQKFVRIKEAAIYTGLKEATLRAYVLNRKIPYIKANGCVLFCLEQLDDWLIERTIPEITRKIG
jgi:excisionase family DNA binding protein